MTQTANRMKLSNNTLAILDNFSGFNQGILITPGNVLRTLNDGESMYAEATVDETFENEVPIGYLSELLKTVSLFKNPEVEFEDSHMNICSGKSKIKYFYTSKKLIKYPTKGMKSLSNPTVSFTLEKKALEELHKASRVIGGETVLIENDGGQIAVSSINEESKNSYTTNVGETNEDFSCALDISALHLLSCNYTVEIYNDYNIVKFINNDIPMFYVVGANAKD